MSEWLKNPSALFDLRGKVAVVTGASGAFGALASKVLAGAGARLVLAAFTVYCVMTPPTSSVSVQVSPATTTALLASMLAAVALD